MFVNLSRLVCSPQHQILGAGGRRAGANHGSFGSWTGWQLDWELTVIGRSWLMIDNEWANHVVALRWSSLYGVTSLVVSSGASSPRFEGKVTQREPQCGTESCEERVWSS